jgi:hypothetical protein
VNDFSPSRFIFLLCKGEKEQYRGGRHRKDSHMQSGQVGLCDSLAWWGAQNHAFPLCSFKRGRGLVSLKRWGERCYQVLGAQGTFVHSDDLKCWACWERSYNVPSEQRRGKNFFLTMNIRKVWGCGVWAEPWRTKMQKELLRRVYLSVFHYHNEIPLVSYLWRKEVYLAPSFGGSSFGSSRLGSPLGLASDQDSGQHHIMVGAWAEGSITPSGRKLEWLRG